MDGTLKVYDVVINNREFINKCLGNYFSCQCISSEGLSHQWITHYTTNQRNVPQSSTSPMVGTKSTGYSRLSTGRSRHFGYLLHRANFDRFVKTRRPTVPVSRIEMQAGAA